MMQDKVSMETSNSDVVGNDDTLGALFSTSCGVLTTNRECILADDLTCKIEPYREEETYLLNTLREIGKCNRPALPPPVWEHEIVGTFSKEFPTKTIPYHYCLLNNNKFTLCTNILECCILDEESDNFLMSSQRKYSYRKGSATTVGSKMGISKEVRSQRRAVIHLARQLKNNCDKIFDQSIPFVVDSPVLRKVCDAINSIYTNRENLEEETPEEVEYRELVMFLSDFCQQTPSLCIALSTSSPSGDNLSSSSASSTPSNEPNFASPATSELKSASGDSAKVDITLFKNLEILELRNTPPSKISGINFVRTNLKKLKCSRCLQSLSQIFTGGFVSHRQPFEGDNNKSNSPCCSTRGGLRPLNVSVPCVWPELKEIDLSFNQIDNISEEVSLLEMCPSVEILNLSRNKIACIDDKFSRVMNSLSVLNLSYNQLTSMPPIPPNLEQLYLSHNLIATISNNNYSRNHISSFSPFKNLKVLDLSTNLITKEEDLLPLKEMGSLEKLMLIGNPISFIEYYRNTVGGYLNRFVITRKFELDKKHLSSSEIRMAIEQCKEGKFIPFIPADSLTISQASAAMMSSMTSTSQGSSSGVSLMKSMTQSYDSSTSSVRSSKRKKPKIREIMTLDFPEGDENAATVTISERMSKSSSPIGSVNSDRIAESAGYRETSLAIKALREKYGPENWLRKQVGQEVEKLLNIPNRPANFDYYSRSLPQDSTDIYRSGNTSLSTRYYEYAGQSPQSIRLANEELIKSKTPKGVESSYNNPDPSLNNSISKESKVKRTPSGEEEEETTEFYSCFSGDSGSNQMETGGEISIFDMAEPSEETFIEEEGKDFESFKIFQSGEVFKLIIYDAYLIEVNLEDSVVINKWDLNCLFCLEEERCDSETESVEFRLKFDTMRKQMRERSFIMSAKDFKRFDKQVSPYIEERTLQEFTEALQCTKCHAQFARAMAGQTVKHEKGEAPRQVSICPIADCGNDILVTLDNIPLPNNECLEFDGSYRPIRTSTPISTSARKSSMPRSIPNKGRSPLMTNFLKFLPSSLTSRPSLDNSNDKNSMDECVDGLKEGEIAPRSNASSSSDTVENTKSESSIEVLSTESSSIEVLRKCGDTSESDIDAEEAIEAPVLDPQTNKHYSKTVGMSESTSSSSCADSVVTTYERNLLPISQPLSSPSVVPSTAPASASTSFSFSFSSTSTLTPNSFTNPPTMSIPIRYDYENFAKTDHRLQLWCDLSVFKSQDERLLALVKCMIISNSKSTGSFLGIVIFSSKKVYMYRIVGNEGDKPQDWLKKFNTFDLSKFTKIDVLIGRHGIGVDFSGKYFAFMLRDCQRTSGFLEFFMSDICGELDQPPMVRDFSQTQKTMLSPTDPISYFGIMRYSVCESPDNAYPISAILLTNQELLMITDLSWMAGRSSTVTTKHGRRLSDLRQVESLETDGSYFRLMFSIETNKMVQWELFFETEREKEAFENCLKTEVKKQEVTFISLSQPLEP